jgi:bifunctional UDP-N-acetylglucosamine pyrophosphorylase/glucosamine-1-phosphate N-acetyltransferase
MRSRFPKVTHRVCGRTMIEQVLRTADEALGGSTAMGEDPDAADGDDHSPRFVIVVGHESTQVRESLQSSTLVQAVAWVTQEPQLGTGDAVRVAQTVWSAPSVPDTLLVLYGDTPLVRADTLRSLLREHQRSGAVLTFLTAIADHPGEYGRVIRDARGEVSGIIERREATPDQIAVREINSGIYCFETEWLRPRLEQLEPHPNGEFYLTDLVSIAVREGASVSTAQATFEETLGVNDRVQLADASAILRQRILREHMLAGVTIIDPATTYVEADARIGMDTVIYPGTVIEGSTTIGERCQIGPYSSVRASIIGDECSVIGSWLEGATMESGSRIGPMSRLRAGAHLQSGANLGNFAEAKNAVIGHNVQMHHFSYVGDAHVGDESNIGAGTITCNYDGVRKHHTEIGEHVFLGSDTLLVAPVTLGDGASTGAGAVVTRDVPPDKLVAGIPARVIRHVSKPDRSTASNAAGQVSTPAAPNAASSAGITRSDEATDNQTSPEAGMTPDSSLGERE